MNRYSPTGRLVLPTLLGEYPKTSAIRDGRVTSPLVTLDIADIAKAQNGFKPLVRELRFDVAEVAIVTYLQARALGKPYVLLPIVINGAFHHGSLIVRAEGPIKSPRDLAGGRIGMRMYSQTTPTWVRGFLQNDYGLDLSAISWITFEDPHVSESHDPANAIRVDGSKSLIDLLIEGEVDAVMMGQGVPDDPRLARLFPDPAAAAREWQAANAGAVPINHMMCVREELAQERPEVVADIFRMLLEARGLMDPPMVEVQAAQQPYGLSRLHEALDRAIRYAHQQELTSRRLGLEEVFAPSTLGLGDTE